MDSAVQDKETGICETGPTRVTPGKFQTVIRISPSCKLLPDLSVDDFRNIQGVYEVHTDTACKTIRIIFDGMHETKIRLADYLCSCHRKPRCGAGQPCARHGEKRGRMENFE